MNKFDGYSVTAYHASSSNPNSLSHRSVTGIAEDSNGIIWLPTEGGGLNSLDPHNHSFRALTFDGSVSQFAPLSNSIYSIYRATDDNLWIGYGEGNGFSRFNPQTGRFIHYPSTTPNKLAITTSFAETPNGFVWVAIENQGLQKIDLSSNTIENVALVDDSGRKLSISPTHLMADRNGNLWISTTSSGLVMYSPGTGKSKQYKTGPSRHGSLSSNQVFMSMEGQEGEIWVATRYGLNVYDIKKGHFYNINRQNSDIPDDQVLSILQSASGMLWVGTFIGLAVGTESRFQRVSTIKGLSGNSINTFTQTDNADLWVGTSQGLNKIRASTQHIAQFTSASEGHFSISSNRVMSLLGEKEVLWVGTMDAGLNRIDLKNEQSEVFTANPPDAGAISANGITSILRTTDGALLVGTYGGGLNTFDETSNTFTHFIHDPSDRRSISNNNVIALLEDSIGYIWVGTEAGLNLYQPETGTFLRYRSNPKNPASLSNDMAWALHEDKDGTLWIGTRSGGLNSWAKEDRESLAENFIRYSDNIDLPSYDIYGVTSDQDGDIWISHNRGISELTNNGTDLINYNVADGLQGREFNHGAVYRSTSGELYFGGNNGYNIIDTTLPVRETFTPPVVLTELRVFDEEVFISATPSEADSLTLDYDFRYARFTFAALDYKYPAQNQYMYKLEGFDDEWITLGTTREVAFTSLPSGQYKLRVRGTNSDGYWSSNEINLPIIVLTPPWLSQWAFLLYASTTIALIALLIYFQRKKQQATLERQIELEKKVELRTADLQKASSAAEDANRAKSEFLAKISHEIRTPMHGMIGMTDLLLKSNLTSQQKKFARAAHDSGNALLSLINNILDFSKLEASKMDLELVEFDLIAVIDEVSYLQSEPASRKGLALYNICDPEIPEKVTGDPTKIRQILMNLVGNAIKFTDQGEVIVRASQMPGSDTQHATVRFVIQDTGIGMNQATSDKVFDAFSQADASTTRQFGGTGLGLAISKQYVEMMGGTISLNSTPDSGTTIEFSIPMEVATIRKSQNSESSVILVTESQLVEEMMISQLQLAGYRTQAMTEFLPATTDASKRLIFVDLESMDSDVLATTDLAVRNRCIILAPIQYSNSFKFSSWNLLEKPVTLNALKSAINNAKGRNDSQEEPGQPNSPTISATRKALKILIAEDIATNQMILTEMLGILGCDVETAENGQLAFDKFQANDFDLVFMDCQMPVMDGFEASRKIREYESINSIESTPIIALTAGISDKDQAACFSAGMDHFVAKPFSYSDIELCIDKYCPTQIVSSKPELNDEIADIASSAECIDFSAVAAIRDVESKTGKQLLNEIYQRFVQQMDEKLEEYELKALRGDVPGIQFTAHAIKSMAANLGAIQLHRISASIEDQCKSGEFEIADSLLASLKSSYRIFKVEFEKAVIT